MCMSLNDGQALLSGHLMKGLKIIHKKQVLHDCVHSIVIVFIEY